MSRVGRSRNKKKQGSTGLRATRRRLSVVSDNKLIEGISSIGKRGTERKTEDESKTNHVIRSFWGSSKKGYAPYNPRKRNQDSILMKECRFLQGPNQYHRIRSIVIQTALTRPQLDSRRPTRRTTELLITLCRDEVHPIHPQTPSAP